MSQHDAYLNKAKTLVAMEFKAAFFTEEDVQPPTKDEFYIVWFAKTLGNWKALVSTDVVDGHYWEVTHNGSKNETYVDHYIKRANLSISDEEYEAELASAPLP